MVDRVQSAQAMAIQEHNIKIAIAHDYLTQRGGAERVVLSLMNAFPEAELHTTLYAPDLTYPEFSRFEIRTSALNHVSGFRHSHRMALPLLPWAVNRMQIDADLVIASSSGWAHGMPTGGKKLVYCYTPARWLYEPSDYFGPNSAPIPRLAARLLTPPLQRWDAKAAQTADRYLAISRVSQARIRSAYDIEASILHPPHAADLSGDLSPVELPNDWDPDARFYLVVSRLMSYKNVDAAVLACEQTGRQLIVVGRGPERANLRAMASAKTLFLEDIADNQLRWLYAEAHTLIAASFEDFGLTPVEAAAFGTPTVALRAGGFLETVQEGRNGLFFDAPTASQIADALTMADREQWDRDTIKASAEKFSSSHFSARIRDEAFALLDA